MQGKTIKQAEYMHYLYRNFFVRKQDHLLEVKHGNDELISGSVKFGLDEQLINYDFARSVESSSDTGLSTMAYKLTGRGMEKLSQLKGVAA